MLLLRSIAFNLFLYGTMAILGLALFPAALVGGEKAIMFAARQWARLSLWGVRIICGIRHEVRGLERLPDGKFIIAAKHQASWETLFFARLFPHPIIVFKKELKAFPLYGWYIARAGMIEVDREAGPSSLKSLVRQAAEKVAPGRPLVIFPEGTRQPPGAPPDYKPGVAALYSKLNLSCIPVALNSGLFWEGKGILRRPGKIIVEFLEPIAPGLSRAEFMRLLEDRIESACRRLLLEAKPPRAVPNIAVQPANR